MQSADGSEAYTRSGHLRLTETGALETNSGELVMGENGPIVLPLPIQNLSIARDGTIMIQPLGAPATIQEEVGRIKFVNPANTSISKGSDGLFRRKDGNDELVNINVKMASGMLESSNVSAISEMTTMIALQRQFEMQLKMMKTAEEIDSSSDALMRAF